MAEIIISLILVFAPIARGAVRIWAFGPIQITVLLLACAAIINIRCDKEALFRKTALDKPILLFLLICLFSFLNTKYFYGSIMEFLRIINLILLFYIVVIHINEERRIKRLLNIILLSSTAIAMFGILQYLGVMPKDWWDRYNFLSATYVNHNHFAGYMELAMPLSIGMFLSEKEPGKKALYLYSFLALSLALALSMSRGAWFSIVIAMIFMFVMIYRKKKGFFAFFLFFVFLAAAAVFILNAADFSVLSRRISSYKELDFSGRIEIWKGTLQIIKHNWLSGTGLGTFIYNFPPHRAQGLNMFVNFSHNDYLQTASETGVFNMILMAAMIFLIIRKGVITHQAAGTSFKRWVSLALVTGVLSLSVHGLGDFNFYIPANAILFTVYAGLIFNISSRKEEGPRYFVLRPGLLRCGMIKTGAVIALIMAVFFTGASLASEIYIGKAQNAVSKDDMEKAAYFAAIAERIMPINSRGAGKLAEVYGKSGDNMAQKIDFLKRSASSYLKALRLNPMDSWLWLGLGDVYDELFRYSLGDYDIVKKADMAYRKAISLDPSNSYYLKRFGRFLFNAGEEKLSSRFYKKASCVMSKSRTLSRLPQAFADGIGYNDIADNAFRSGDIKKALAFYKMAEEFLIEEEAPAIGQVRACMKLGMVREAIVKYRGMKSSKEGKAALLASLADYCFRRGYFNTAMRLAERSLKIYPDSPEAYQVIYKASKETGRDRYPAHLIQEILRFNQLRMSHDIKPDGFAIEFVLQEELINEGSIKKSIVLPAGIYEFKIKARGKAADGVWPHMAARFNGKDAIDAYVNSAEWQEYSGIIIADFPINNLEIVYDNDYYNSGNTEDRNLYIGGITLKSL